MFKKIIQFIKKGVLWFLEISFLVVVIYKFVPVPVTPLMVSKTIEQKLKGEEIICSHDWVPLEEIAPNMQKAVIASEDGLFLKHYGFDFTAMKKAFKNNNKGRRIKGGSTISQQTAKNVFLWQGRSYIRKIFEAYFTVLIETVWGKERIMEVYLNSIEMGKGIYGVQAAANYWYQKPAANLSAKDAAGIAAILPNPIRFHATNSSSFINKRKIKIMKVMRSLGALKY
jgi:monofunctional glycosyltransferase